MSQGTHESFSKMVPGKIFVITLLLSLLAVCLSEKLSSKQIDFFKKNVRKWGAPPIEKVIGGNVQKTKRGKVMEIQYESGDQVCKAFHTKKRTRKGVTSSKWSCASKMVDEDDTSEELSASEE
uniref:Eukaryotic translation initiation factor 3 subunit L n=1 Tax=Lygus hesperus TaxID=30085 RepID=A0A0A9YY50_LYGHE